MQSDYPITRITPPDKAGVHTYFDVCPESPDGERVVHFVYTGRIDPPWGRGQVCVTDRNGGNPRLLGDATEAHTQNGLFQQWLNDRQVAYQPRRKRRDDPATAVVDVDTGEVTLHEGAQIRMASPDGTKALCHRGVPAVPDPDDFRPAMWSVRMLDFATGRFDELFTTADAWAIHPLRGKVNTPLERLYFKHTKWIPGGDRFMVVFTGEKRPPGEDRVKSIFLADADGGNLRYLTEFSTHPFWSPYGSEAWALMRADGGALQLVGFPVDGGERQVRSEPFRGSHASARPDGRYLAIDSFTEPWCGEGEGAVFLYDLQTHEQRPMATFTLPDCTNATGCHPHPVWSRDGRRVFFNAVEDGRPALYAAELDELE